MKQLIIIFILLLGVVQLQDISGQQQLTDLGREHLVEGKIRIKLKRESLKEVNTLKSAASGTDDNSIGLASIDQLNKDLGILRIKRVFPFSLKHESKHRDYGLHLWFELDFDENVNPQGVAAQYDLLDEVQIAKPVMKKVRIDSESEAIPLKVDELTSNGNKRNHKNHATLKAAGTGFDDPMLNQQWHYENDGTVGTANVDIDLFNAWTKSTGSNNVIVAIVDGGIDTDHEDLIDNLWVNEAELNGEEGVDDDQNGYIDDVHGNNFRLGGPVSAHGHGTHVAGTVGAVSNNGIGVAGVAGGDGTGNGVRLISCQVFDDRVGGGANFAAAIVYGADHGAVISQNSWGYTTPGYYEPEVLDAVKYFKETAGDYEGSPMKGGILFFAAGNSGQEHEHYPAAFDEVVAVTSTGPAGYPAPYSNYGTWTDIAAPGGDQAYYEKEGGVLSTLPDNKYGFLQGTSMACPHVSGVAALVVSKFGNDNFRARDLETIILGSTTSFAFESEGKYGVGNLNASRALDENNHIAPQAITDLAANDIYHDRVTLQWTVPADEDNFEPSHFYLAVSLNEITPGNFGQQTVYQLANPFEAGSDVSVTLNGLRKQTNYWFAIKSADRHENVSDISNILKVTTANTPHFSESTRELNFNIDVMQSAQQVRTITFSNTGEGIVDWNSYTVNEADWWEDLVEWTAQEEAAVAAASATPELFETTRPTTQSLAATTSDYVHGPAPEHWYADNTAFVAGLSYESGGIPMVVGSGTDNAGLICATRFEVPKDMTFNLTHLEAAMYLTQKEKPVVVELRSGSEHFEESRSIYVQEYYADTTNIPLFYRIPLLKNERFSDGEYFWVVLHYPQEEVYPHMMEQVFNRIDYTGFFMVSTDNGVSYDNAYTKFSGRFVPMLRALSTGDDGAYVFVQPNYGSIKSGESQQVAVTVDAAQLRNGKHLASVGIVTNDENKPGINIEVKVQVTGQEASAKLEDSYSFDVLKDADNKLYLKLQNGGLDTLEIYDLYSVNANITKRFNDTIIVTPELEVYIPFNYSTTTAGIINEHMQISTSIGVVDITAEMICREAAAMDVSLNNSTITVNANATEEFELSITNTGNGTVLEYDLEHYSMLKVDKGVLSNQLSYAIQTSDDGSGLAANQWDEISSYGNAYGYAYFWTNNHDLKMNFPLFNQSFVEAYGLGNGNIYFSTYGKLGHEELGYGESYGSGMLAPLHIRDMMQRLESCYVYAYGDRAVFTFDVNLGRWDDERRKGIYDKAVKYQVVLFRDGAIEYRYLDVEDLADYDDYVVGLQGFDLEDYYVYRSANVADVKVYNGLVIRFEPQNDVSFVSLQDAPQGFIQAGESATLKFEVNPGALNIGAGSYTHQLNVKANTVSGVESLPLSITVMGQSTLSCSDTLAFDWSRIDQSVERFASVRNTGSAKASITSVSFDHADFSVSESFPIDINDNAEYQLPIDYTPSTSGVVEANMTVNYSTGNSEQVLLIAEGKEDPSYTIAIDPAIAVSLNGGERTTVPFTLTNSNKGVDLEYAFVNSVFTSAEANGLVKAFGDNEEELLDDYGYSWKVSDEAGIFYKWNDISEDSEQRFIKHEEQHALALPFEFPFYGEVYDTIWISKNGYVTVIEPEKDPYDLEFEKEDGVRGMIAPFWTWLKPPTNEDGVKFKVTDDRVYVQWNAFISEDSGYSGGAITFQLEIVKDGSIYFHYQDVLNWAGTIQYGLESPDESETFEKNKSWILKWTDVKDKTTIAIAPPTKDKLISGEAKDFELVLSAENIFRSGTYADTVVLHTNCSLQPALEIPVSIQVTGQPELIAPAELVWEEVIFSNNCQMRQTVTLKNKGHETVLIDQVQIQNLDGLTLWAANGEEMLMNSSGQLMTAIEIAPWDVVTFDVEIPVLEKANVNGTIQLLGDADNATIGVKAVLVDSPVFAWDAQDKEYSLNYTTEEQFSFTIENLGETTLSYDLLPAVTPSGEGDGYPIIVEEIGNFTFEDPSILDSVIIDKKDEGDGVFTPMVVGNAPHFANGFTAPEGGFVLTHIKTYNYLKKLGEYINIMVYMGGDDPTAGQKLYEQKYVIDRYVDQEWIYFPLEQPIIIPEGEKFYLITSPPRDYKFIGFDISDDEEALNESYQGGFDYNKGYGIKWASYAYMQQVWKIRAISAGGKGQWLELDHLTGEVVSGSSAEVTATIHSQLAGKGTHKAKIIVKSNDVSHPMDDAAVTININGAPELKYRPNSYADTLRIVETHEDVFSYVVADPEGETMTFTMEDQPTGPKVVFEQLDNNTAQVTVSTDYESAGVYSYEVSIADDNGNVVKDNVIIEVLDKNRPPVLNPDFEIINLNLAEENSTMTIHGSELFSDPDGDEPMLLAGNYTPHIVDMAMGYSYIDLHPLSEGTGFLVFGADDGKENGFVVYGVYVIVLDDETAVTANPSAFGEEAKVLLQSGQDYTVYPNMVTNQNTNMIFKLDEAADVSLEIYDMNGRKCKQILLGQYEDGIYTEHLNLGGLKNGVYICSYIVNGQMSGTSKIVISNK